MKLLQHEKDAIIKRIQDKFEGALNKSAAQLQQVAYAASRLALPGALRKLPLNLLEAYVNTRYMDIGSDIKGPLRFMIRVYRPATGAFDASIVTKRRDWKQAYLAYAEAHQLREDSVAATRAALDTCRTRASLQKKYPELAVYLPEVVIDLKSTPTTASPDLTKDDRIRALLKKIPKGDFTFNKKMN